MGLALAQTSAAGRVVVVGDGLVANPPESMTAGRAVPGGWVAVLGDCLEEAAGKGWTVVDRTAPGATAANVRAQLADVKALQPTLVVVSVGAREAAGGVEAARFATDLQALASDLRGAGPRVLLVGLVPPTLVQVGRDPQQEGADDSVRAIDAVLHAAASSDGIRHLSLFARWPSDAAARSELTSDAYGLSAKGHARAGQLVCEEVSRWNAGR